MSWDLIGDVPVTFEGQFLEVPVIGDALIKIEHTFDYASFPGLGYALFSSRYYNDVVADFFRSYPRKNEARLHVLELADVQKESGWLLRDLFVRRSTRARVQADANWRVKVYEWIDSADPEGEIDGDGSTPSDGQQIYDGNS